jgi:hypothetical protein
VCELEHGADLACGPFENTCLKEEEKKKKNFAPASSGAANNKNNSLHCLSTGDTKWVFSMS